MREKGRMVGPGGTQLRGGRCFCVALLSGVALSLSAQAQEEGRFDISPLRPSGAPQDLVMVRQSRPIGHLSMAAGSFLDLSLNPL